MWCLGTWFSSRLSSGRFAVGLNDHKGLYHPKWFYDSMKCGRAWKPVNRNFNKEQNLEESKIIIYPDKISLADSG